MNKDAQRLGKKRWKGISKKDRKNHAMMMVRVRQNKSSHSTSFTKEK